MSDAADINRAMNRGAAETIPDWTKYNLATFCAENIPRLRQVFLKKQPELTGIELERLATISAAEAYRLAAHEVSAKESIYRMSRWMIGVGITGAVLYTAARIKGFDAVWLTDFVRPVSFALLCLGLPLRFIHTPGEDAYFDQFANPRTKARVLDKNAPGNRATYERAQSYLDKGFYRPAVSTVSDKGPQPVPV